MSEYIQFIFSGTIFHPNILPLPLFGAFHRAWLAQRRVWTELNSPTAELHFSFATIFYDINLVRFCLYSKVKFSCEFCLKPRKPFVDIFFHHREKALQKLGTS